MKHFWFGCFGTLGAGGALLFWPARSVDEVVILDVGQGSAALIRSGKSAVLIDTGPRLEGYDAGRQIVIPRLRSLGVNHVDLILLSHPDSDHAGGLQAIAHRFPAARVGMPSDFRKDPAVLAQLAKAGVPESRMLWLEGANRLRLGELRLAVWSPRWRQGESDNDGSMFVRASVAGATALWTGDASESIEEQALRSGEWSTNLLVLGHHGSKTATSDGWLRACRPEIAVASAGRRNAYGHPHQSVQRKLAARKIPLLRTDRDGELRFQVRDGRFIRVR